MAASSIPSAGKGPMPKISSGSRMILETQPTISPAIVTFILPDTLEDLFIGKVDGVYGCKQKYNCRIMVPRLMTSVSEVNKARNPGMIRMQPTVRIIPCRAARIRP